MNVYPEEYTRQFDIIEEGWSEDREPDAKRIRDRRARDLRKQGWTVRAETYDFTDLARTVRYCIHAVRIKKNVYLEAKSAIMRTRLPKTNPNHPFEK